MTDADKSLRLRNGLKKREETLLKLPSQREQQKLPKMRNGGSW